MNRRRKCCVCKQLFVPHPRMGDRQKTCGRKVCQKKRHQETDAIWLRSDPNYYSDRYRRVLVPWLESNPGYLKRYRAAHPEYVERNRKMQRFRDQAKKNDLSSTITDLDIQAELIKDLQVTAKKNDNVNFSGYADSQLDKQAEIIPQCLVVVGQTLKLMSFLDIQAQFARAP